MQKNERHAYVLSRAKELAATGQFYGWHAIEGVLRFKERYPEARQFLDDSFIRSELDSICSDARKRKTDA